MPRPLVFVCVFATVALTLWGVTSVRATVIKAEAFLISEGWSAAAEGDYRLAISSFSAALDERGLSSAPLEGLACVSWAAGYQDYALWNHQLYMGLKSRPLSDINPCIGDLAIWGIATTTIQGITQIFPEASNPREDVLQTVAVDVGAPPAHRYGAMACLSHKKGLRLLSSLHLQGLARQTTNSPTTDKDPEPLPATVEACVSEQIDDYEARGNAVVPEDAFERFLVSHLSPLPSENGLVLPMPRPVGPDGESLEPIGVAGE